MVAAQVQHSTSCDPGTTLGSIEPRLCTPPLRELTPATTYGFDVVEFARDVLGMPLDEWQQRAVIRAGELLDDGRPRFRYVLMLVSRQNGKSHLLVVLTLYWLFVERQEETLSMSTSLEYAKEAWEKACDMAKRSEPLAPMIARSRRAVGGESLDTTDGCRYRIAAANNRAGRSMTIDRLIIDEFRAHTTWDAWNASVPATNARSGAQVWLISNQGDDSSMALNSVRESALDTLDGGGDRRTGIFEWSAPDGSEPDDVDAIAQANPNLGRRIDVDSILSEARRAKRQGGIELTGFLTEYMCMRVSVLQQAINPVSWRECSDVQSMDGLRDRVALCMDVSLDGGHATLAAAAVQDDGRVRVEIVAAYDSTASLRRGLKSRVRNVAPRMFGWLPDGPAAAVAAELDSKRSKSREWPPRGVGIEPIRGELAAVSMGLNDLIESGQIAHPDDPLLNDQISQVERKERGDGYVFSRRGEGDCDAVYAVAGAVHLARMLPIRRGQTRIVRSSA